ncbi:MAG: hypothetical protein A2W98_09935 [Bacteroidetes bacterium GWF2_33_38]|nr:MAG: hypothetical protein A2W98_09935 [Bacteroidetes bacterium GWF2_33_38]OFY72827.1 MAG: hypothetical protein A2265_09535 [Bacteroidetes bacterium RIFOXYA12_FULL_33_9]HBX52595.1 hypothetical protein [Bacteroidales bacterium]
MKKIIYIISFFLLMSTPILAQPPLPSPSGSIVILSGGNVVFNFTSLNKYVNGITLTEWTKLAIKYDSDGGGTHWRLAVRATTANFEGDGGSLMDLDVLELTAVDGGGNNNLIGLLEPTIELAFIDQDLVSGVTPDGTALDDNLVNITYECGITNPVIDFVPDYYNVDIEITLYED